MRPAKVYSQFQVCFIRSLRAKPMTLKEIFEYARPYGFTQTDIHKILGKTGHIIDQKIPKEVDREELRRMYFEDRMKICEIADKYGVSRQRVSQLLGGVEATVVRKKRNFGSYKKSPRFKFLVAARKLFWSNIRRDDSSGCWIWEGHKNCNEDYGRIVTSIDVGRYVGNSSNQISPRVFAWFLVHGERMKNPFAPSICGHTLCCNPDHIPGGSKESKRSGRARQASNLGRAT